MSVGDFVELDGWLVIIDYRLFVIPSDYSENYEDNDRVEISTPELIFAVVDKVHPLAGGRSFIFHRTKVSGFLIDESPKKIKPIAIFVEERGGGFVSVSVNEDELRKYKNKYNVFLSWRDKESPDDWLDYL